MTIPLLTPVHQWYCPNCPVTDTTHEPRPHTRFHECAGLLGLTAPLIEVGINAKVEAKEREDYIGTEQVGRVMSVVTTRDEGQDVAVFAPVATGKVEEL